MVGSGDAFVLKLSPGQQNPLSYSTIFGGSGNEEAEDIVIDPSNNVYVVGWTGTKSAAGFLPEAGPPLKPDVIGVEGEGSDHDAWVARFDAAGKPNTNKYFVYLTGKDSDNGRSITLFSSGANIRLYVTGSTLIPDDNSPTNFPDKSTLQKLRGSNAFLAYLDPALAGANSLLFATFIGGSGREIGYSVAVDSAGNAYVAGSTDSRNFRPPKPPGFQQQYGGAGDGFAVKITFDPLPNKRSMLNPVGNQSATVGVLLTFQATATDADNDPITFTLWDEPTGATIDPDTGLFEWTPGAGQGPGVYTFAVQASDPYGAFDEEFITVTVSDSGGSSDLPGDDLTTALPVYLQPYVTAQIEEEVGNGLFGGLDVDLFRVDLLTNQTLAADIDAFALDDGGQLSTLDGYLRIFDQFGAELVFNDDGIDPETGLLGFDPALLFTAPGDGVYYVGISGSPNGFYDPNVPGNGIHGSTGAYRLQLTLLPAELPEEPGSVPPPPPPPPP